MPPETLTAFGGAPDWNLVRELVEMFLSDGIRQLRLLESAAASGDLPTLARISHSLKGSAQVLDAAAVVELTTAIEENARSGTLRDYSTDVRRLAATFEATRVAMLPYRGEADR